MKLPKLFSAVSDKFYTVMSNLKLKNKYLLAGGVMLFSIIFILSIFSLIVFVVFAPIFWDGFHWSVLQCTTCALTGALAELVMEIAFSPIGYRIVKKWRAESVGKAYLDFVSGKEKAE